MPLLGGIFARNNKSAPPDLGPSPSQSSSSNYDSPNPSFQINSQPSNPASSASSPTAEYVSLSFPSGAGAGPSSPNGRGLAYAGEPPAKEKRGLGFFGRKRSTNALAPPSPNSPGRDGRSMDWGRDDGDPRGGPRPNYLARLSTSSELPPRVSTSPYGSPNSLRPPGGGFLGTGSPSTRSLPPPQTSLSLSPGGASNYSGYAGSPLAPQISPTKSTASGWTAKTTGGKGKGESKSAGVKAGRKFAFWTRGGSKTPTEPPSPTPSKRGGQGGEGAESEFNLRAFRHVSPNATPPNPSSPNPYARDGAKLTASALSALNSASPSADDLSAPRRPRPRGGSDASASSSRISVAAFREVVAQKEKGRSPSPGPGMERTYGGGGAATGSMYSLGGAGNRSQPGNGSGYFSQQGGREQQYPQRQEQQHQQQHQRQQQQQPQPQQTPTRPPAPPAKTTPGKHYQPRSNASNSHPNLHNTSASANANPAKKSGHARTHGRWDSEESESPSGQEESEEEESDEVPVRRTAKSEVGHGQQVRRQERQEMPPPRSASSLGMYGGAGMGESKGNVTSKRLSQPQLPALQIPGGAIRPQAAPQQSQQRPQPPPAAASSDSESSSESSEDSDDAPLATLVAPRRPGSALSSLSNVALNSAGASGSQPNLAYGNLPHSALAKHNRSGSQSGSSIASSSRPANKPKPLIDIAELTASKPTLASKPEKDGFTGGGMLASVPNAKGKGGDTGGAKGDRGPVLTSRSPPVRADTGLVHFPSPPSSPKKEVPPHVVASVGVSGPPQAQPKTQAQRSIPMRRETATSAASLPPPSTASASTSPSPSPSASSSPVVQKRDVLSERLRAVAAANAASANAERERLQENAKKQTPSTVGMEKKTPPPPAFANVAARKAFHRRSSSDIISAQKRTWADDAGDGDGDGDNYRDSVLGRDLADMLGGGIALVTRNGDWSPEKTKPSPLGGNKSDGEMESREKREEVQEQEKRDKDSIAPIVIKQRSPPPAFSVTSRPAHSQNRSMSAFSELGGTPGRQRSSTLVPVSSSLDVWLESLGDVQLEFQFLQRQFFVELGVGTNTSANVNPRAEPRQRSSTMMPLGQQQPAQPAPKPVAAPTPALANVNVMPPTRPFATPRMQRNSPASSTGDSSSGPAPLTPRDGSDFGENSGGGAARDRDDGHREWSGGVSGLVPSGPGRRIMAHQRRSVSFDFDEDVQGDGKGKAKAKAKPHETPLQEEERRRRERRRSEARAAIELGNVINGPGPTVDDDEEEEDEDDVPINQARMNPMMNPMGMGMGMGMGMPMNNMNMNMSMPMGMNMPLWYAAQRHVACGLAWRCVGPVTSGAAGDAQPRAIHGRAARGSELLRGAPAGDDVREAGVPDGGGAAGDGGCGGGVGARVDVWRRGCEERVWGGGGGGVRGSMYSVAGGGGSVIGGPTAGMGSPFGMPMGMQGMGGWGSPGAGSLFPPAPRSMYGGGGARSEYGGPSSGGGGGNWSSSRSVYGETFGPSTERYARTTSSGNLAAQGGKGSSARGEGVGVFPADGSGVAGAAGAWGWEWEWGRVDAEAADGEPACDPFTERGCRETAPAAVELEGCSVIWSDAMLFGRTTTTTTRTQNKSYHHILSYTTVLPPRTL
ncbi:hypothetical protein MVEN_01464200 [Mycena venus]|uniref:Uncharacterized protein n=1 Tax=Mycena venus TaxID=2733690 RepID=A0A8H6XV27_9AGAR|nr:hypothetical protein MVEN_01464200 [Mycena venus]